MTAAAPAPTLRSVMDGPPAAAAIMAINRYRLTQLIFVVATLRIADRLAAGPRSVAALARECGADAPALFRVLRATASLGVFRQDDAGRFENTPLSATLCVDASPSLHAYALLLGEAWHWRLWQEVLSTVQTGAPAFPRLFGGDLRDFRRRHPEAARIFAGALDAILGLDTPAMLALHDFAECRTLLYPGFAGGWGRFLPALLQAHPAMRVILLDLPEHAETARRALLRAGIAERCQVVAAEPDAPLPAGADVHLFRHFLTYLGDAEAVAMLRASRRALGAGGRLLVAGMLVAPGNEWSLAKLVDLEAMLVSADAHERSEAEYRGLLGEAGFRVTRVLAGPAPTRVIEAVTEDA